MTTTSGVLIPTIYQPEWVDLLRAQSVLNTAGMRTVSMLGKTENLQRDHRGPERRLAF